MTNENQKLDNAVTALAAVLNQAIDEAVETTDKNTGRLKLDSQSISAGLKEKLKQAHEVVMSEFRAIDSGMANKGNCYGQ